MSDPKTLDADTFRFSIEPRIAAPFHDGATEHVIDAADGRVVAAFDSRDRAVAVQEVLEAAHDVGVAARHALRQPTDTVPLTRLGDVLRESVAGVLARPAVVVPFGQVDAAEKARADTEADGAAEMEAQANREQARADAAEQMVAELRTLVGRMEAKANAGWLDDDHACVECVGTASPRWVERWTCARHSIDAALSRTEAVAGRWVPKAAMELALARRIDADNERRAAINEMVGLIQQRDAAIAARDEAVARAESLDRQFTEAAKRAYECEHKVKRETDAAVSWRAGCRQTEHQLRDTRTALDAAERARDEALAESAQWREALTIIIRELDDEDGCMGIDCEPLSAKEVSAQDVATAITKRAHELQGWVRRYIMGEPMRGDATSEEEHARAQVMTLICDRDNAIRARDEVGIQLAAAQAEIARLAPFEAAARRAVIIGDVAPLVDLVALDAVPGDALAPVDGAFKIGDRVAYRPANPPEAFTGTVDMLEDKSQERVNGKWMVRVRRDEGFLPQYGMHFWATADVLTHVVPPSPAGALAPRSWSGIKNAMWADANARVAQLEQLLREAKPVLSDCVEYASVHRVYVDGVEADGLVDRITSALEASGIDTSNVKEVE